MRMSNTHRKYSPHEDEIIIAMHSKGFTPHDIVKVLISRSVSSVKDRGYVLGLKWTHEPEIDEKLFKELMGK